jgi:chromosome segregation ATPase
MNRIPNEPTHPGGPCSRDASEAEGRQRRELEAAAERLRTEAAGLGTALESREGEIDRLQADLLARQEDLLAAQEEVAREAAATRAAEERLVESRRECERVAASGEWEASALREEVAGLTDDCAAAQKECGRLREALTAAEAGLRETAERAAVAASRAEARDRELQTLRQGSAPRFGLRSDPPS